MIGAEPSVAQAYVQKKLPVEVSHTPWYADAKGEAWQALEMKGTPVIIGIRKGRMEWDDQRPAEGFRHPDLCHPELGGILSPTPELKRHDAKFPLDGQSDPRISGPPTATKRPEVNSCPFRSNGFGVK